MQLQSSHVWSVARTSRSSSPEFLGSQPPRAVHARGAATARCIAAEIEAGAGCKRSAAGVLEDLSARARS